MGYAEPGATETVTATLRRRRKTLTNNLENHNPLLRSMKAQKTIEMATGGRTIFEESLFQETGNVASYHGSSPFNMAINPVMTALEIDWKQFGGAIVINGREERMNSGDAQSINLLSGRVEALEYSMENFLNAALAGDGTSDGGMSLSALKYWITTTPTAGTVGGVDRSGSGAVWARNFKFATTTDNSSGAPGGAATSASNIKAYYNWCINSTMRGNDKVKVLLAGQQHYEFLQSALQAMQVIMKDSQSADSGYSDLSYLGIPVAMASGGINFTGAAALATDRTYGVNTRFTKLVVHKDAYMEPLPEMQSINQDAKAQISVFMGNVMARFPLGNFVMYDS